MQDTNPHAQQQQSGENQQVIPQNPHQEEEHHEVMEGHEDEYEQPEEADDPQYPYEAQEPQEGQAPEEPMEDQDEMPLEPEAELQFEPETEEAAEDNDLEQEQAEVEETGEEEGEGEEGRSSNGPPEYNPDLIDDQDQQAAGHPLMEDGEQLEEQVAGGEYYMGEEKIEHEGPSEVSHVYAQQELIEEWRDEEVPLPSPHDYHFAGIHEEEAIEHPPHLLSTEVQVGSSLMKLQPLPAQAVQTLETPQPPPPTKPETVQQSAETDPPPVPPSTKSIPAPTQVPKVELQSQTDEAPIIRAVKPAKPAEVQSSASVKSTIPKDPKSHHDQNAKDNFMQPKVVQSEPVKQAEVMQQAEPVKRIETVKQVQAVKKSETVKQSQTSVKSTAPKTPIEQSRSRRQAEKTIQSNQAVLAQEQTSLKKENSPNLLVLRSQNEAKREKQAEQSRLEHEETRKSEFLEQQRLVRLERESEEQDRQRRETERAESERRQRQRELMEQRQKQREQMERREKEQAQKERQRIAKEQQRHREKQMQQRQQQRQAQNASQASRASMDREDPQQATSSLPPPTIAKKKKKKKASKHPEKAAALPDAIHPPMPPHSPPANNHPSRDSESERDRVSEIHSQIEAGEPRTDHNLVSELLSAQGPVGKAGVPAIVLTSLMVVREAEKERVGTTFRMFLKYNYEYDRTVTAYKRIISNVTAELQRKKLQKRPLQHTLEDYFQEFAKISKEFNERCYRLQAESVGETPSKNPLASLRVELKKGFDEMVFLRKSVANNANRLSASLNAALLPQLRKAFEGYYLGIGAEEGRQAARRQELLRREKQMARVVAQAERIFQRGLQGRFKEDLFIQLVRFINEEKLLRATLRNYGRGLLDLRQAYIRSEKELFDQLQELLVRFKTEWWAGYGERREWRDAEGLGDRIREALRFAQLCTLVDLDYVKYVLELQSKQERERFGSRDFENYLDLVFFDRVVGNIRDLLKGATNKTFPLRAEGEELVHSISGNLVLFHRPLDLCRDHFRISSLNAKVVATGTVEFDELQKGILFDDSRTVRLQLKDDDRAEELICYLNEKEEDILLPS